MLDLRQQSHHHRGQHGVGYSDVATRFIGYGWNVTRVGDANNLEMLERAFTTFKNTTDRPTLIMVDSHIAYGAPNKQDTSAAHGEPLGEEEIRLAKRHYGWRRTPSSSCPTACASISRPASAGAGKLHAAWWAKFEEYRQHYPELAEHGYRTAPRAARRLGPRLTDVPRRRQGDRQPRRLGPGVEHPRQERAVAAQAQRISRPHARHA